MGWWSENIMGGDTPLDIESFIYHALEIEQFPDQENDNYGEVIKIPADKFDYDKIVAYLKNREKDDYWLKGDYGNIFHQVLGVLMMKFGAPISDDLKKKMIEAAENDVWANGDEYDEADEDRKSKMDDFIKTLNSYDGVTPIKINSKGLFETIAEGLFLEAKEKQKEND